MLRRIAGAAWRCLPETLREKYYGELEDRILGRERAILRRRGAELEITLDHVISDYRQTHERITFLQIGANDGVIQDAIFPLIEKHSLSGVLIEPQRGMFERLRANYEKFPSGRFTLINAAISDRDGTKPLFRLADTPDVPDWALGIASFDREFLVRHCDWWKAEQGVDLESLIQVEYVETLTFPTLFAKHQISPVALLQVDTEGYDGQIIRMFDVPARKPAIVRFEHKHLPRDERDYCFNMLADQGYGIAVSTLDAIAYHPKF